GLRVKRGKATATGKRPPSRGRSRPISKTRSSIGRASSSASGRRSQAQNNPADAGPAPTGGKTERKLHHHVTLQFPRNRGEVAARVARAEALRGRRRARAAEILCPGNVSLPVRQAACRACAQLHDRRPGRPLPKGARIQRAAPDGV